MGWTAYILKIHTNLCVYGVIFYLWVSKWHQNPNFAYQFKLIWQIMNKRHSPIQKISKNHSCLQVCKYLQFIKIFYSNQWKTTEWCYRKRKSRWELKIVFEENICLPVLNIIELNINLEFFINLVKPYFSMYNYISCPPIYQVSLISVEWFRRSSADKANSQNLWIFIKKPKFYP